MSLGWIPASQLWNEKAAWSLERPPWCPTLRIAVSWFSFGSQGGWASGSIHSVLRGTLAASRWNLVWRVDFERFALRASGCRGSSLWRRAAADSTRESRAISMGGRAVSLYREPSGV